jgi:hypothetical protein
MTLRICHDISSTDEEVNISHNPHNVYPALTTSPGLGMVD